MKKLTFKICLLCLAVLTIHHFVEGLLPSSVNSKLWQKKVEDFKNQPEKINTLFIGSSHVFRHVDPELFDRSLPATGVSSYNLGIGGLQLKETIELARQVVIAEHSGDLQFLFVFLRNKNVETGWGLLKQMLKYTNKPGFEHFNTLMYRRLFGLDKNISSIFKNPLFPRTNTCKGFTAIEWEPQTPAIKSSQTELITKKKYWEYVHALGPVTYRKHQNCRPENSWYTRNIASLIQLGMQKEIKVMVVLHPIQGPYYEQIMPVFNSVPREHRIDLANPDHFAHLYDKSLFFDLSHYNMVGASALTSALAGEFKKTQERLANAN